MDRKTHDINLAREVGFNTEHPATNEWLHQYAEKVRAEEREACAKVCDENELPFVADSIRARGQK